MQLMRHAKNALIATAILCRYFHRSVRVGADFYQDLSVRNTERVDWTPPRQFSDSTNSLLLAHTLCQSIPSFADTFGGRTAKSMIRVVEMKGLIVFVDKGESRGW